VQYSQELGGRLPKGEFKEEKNSTSVALEAMREGLKYSSPVRVGAGLFLAWGKTNVVYSRTSSERKVSIT